MIESIGERKGYLFRVSEFGDGTPWIYWEPRDGELSALEGCIMGFQLRPGTSLAEAEAFARSLNGTIDSVCCTITLETGESKHL